MNAATLEAYAERVVSAAPPLTAAQVDQVVTILRAATTSGAGR
ncbi:hypothetical protein [Microbacterium sp. C7(2022)]|nr:hypothetical protein [Microbacterium sp. C7(2022)]MDE0545488.1 hypothetical protein [Microbacterium sp. C7(2022)]